MAESKAKADARELLLTAAKDDLALFCKILDRRFKVARHSAQLIEHLEGVERGDIRRLIVTLPPRHGKSMLISQLFPCWFLGRHPAAQVIQTGYSQDIALFHSRRARDYFSSARFHQVFPGVLHEPERPAQEVVEVSKQSAHEWGSRQGGRYYAVGVGGGITGRGADLGLIDDPLKNREEANSPTTRAKVLDWYRSTFYTRLSPEGRIVVVMTRWHRQDLVGRLIEEIKDGGEAWTVMNCKAIGDDGAALWPEVWPVARLLQIKRAIGSLEFSALYQQEPRDPDSGMFQRQWFVKIVEDWPADITNWVRYWDPASTPKSVGKDPDWTAGALVGMSRGVWYLRDMKRVRLSPKGVQDLIRQTAKLDPRGTKIRMEQEGGASGKMMIDHYAREVLVGYDFAGVPSLKSKEIRAGPLSAAAEAGNVVLVRGDWVQDFLDQAETFPGGDHDDMIDAATGAMNEIAGNAGGGSERARQTREEGEHRGIGRMMV